MACPIIMQLAISEWQWPRRNSLCWAWLFTVVTHDKSLALSHTPKTQHKSSTQKTAAPEAQLEYYLSPLGVPSSLKFTQDRWWLPITHSFLHTVLHGHWYTQRQKHPYPPSRHNRQTETLCHHICDPSVPAEQPPLFIPIQSQTL